MGDVEQGSVLPRRHLVLSERVWRTEAVGSGKTGHDGDLVRVGEAL